MEKIAIIYSFNTQKTSQAAKRIIAEFGEKNIDILNAEEITAEKFLSYKNLILGVPTWFDGELPNYWDEFVPEIKTMNLSGKRIALFGNGDQEGYPENFVDAVGIMASILEKQEAVIVGYTSSDGYTFEHSKALHNGYFCGLALDFENQSKLLDIRIKNWCDQLKEEFS